MEAKAANGAQTRSEEIVMAFGAITQTQAPSPASATVGSETPKSCSEAVFITKVSHNGYLEKSPDATYAAGAIIETRSAASSKGVARRFAATATTSSPTATAAAFSAETEESL